MKNLTALMQREWLQHRFAWAMLVAIPLGLALLLLSVGHIDLDGDISQRSGTEMATMLGAASMLITTTSLFLLVWVTSVFITTGLARRDHADRSIEFWLSLPTGHSESLAAPLLVHLVLVPAAALLIGLLGGFVISLLLVGRFVGLAEWFALPWATLLPAVLSVTLRVVAGLPLATLWLMPLLLLAMLSNAVFKRWGLPLFVVSLSLTAALLKAVFGQPLLADALRRLGMGAGLSLAGASGDNMVINDNGQAVAALAHMPRWALEDFGAALGMAASPAFVAAMVVSAGLFYLLVLWRQRGASSGV